jgi:rSAM/selenodomain-associated transferase 2
VQSEQGISFPGKISIVIPVLDEVERINCSIEKVLSQKGGKNCEVIVVDGDPNGETINAICHRDVITAISEKGRAKQMNVGASLARGEILLFLHADTELPPLGLEQIIGTLADERYVGGAFDLGVDSDNFWIKAIVARTRIRSRLTRIPYGDQAIFVRKKYFEEIGGFRDIPFLEDAEFMRRIKKRGDEIFILRDRVKTSARRWKKEGIGYTTLRNMLVVVLYRLGVSPQKLAKYYRSHSDESSGQKERRG